MAKWSIAFRIFHEFSVEVDAPDEDAAIEAAEGMDLAEHFAIDDLDYTCTSVDPIEPGEFCEGDDRDE